MVQENPCGTHAVPNCRADLLLARISALRNNILMMEEPDAPFGGCFRKCSDTDGLDYDSNSVQMARQMKLMQQHSFSSVSAPPPRSDFDGAIAEITGSRSLQAQPPQDPQGHQAYVGHAQQPESPQQAGTTLAITTSHHHYNIH